MIIQLIVIATIERSREEKNVLPLIVISLINNEKDMRSKITCIQCEASLNARLLWIGSFQ